ncbi:MAG: tyrosine-type recombinase/integrase [Chloroflexota bacterium]|nr:tyrosine-type recombinase/integrase [Chloroflexota bacterium]
MSEIRWERYPAVGQSPHARAWLTIQANLQLTPNTVAAYGRALEEYLAFCAGRPGDADGADRAHVSTYVRHLAERPSPRGANGRALDSGARLANATIQLRLTAVRLYYDYLVEVGVRTENPVGRGRYTPGGGFGGARERGLVRRSAPLPWIPSDDEYRRLLDAATAEPLRNQFMLMLAYTCALRREELCALTMADVTLAPRGVRVRAEATKGRRERFVPYTDVVDPFYAAYLGHRRALSRETGALFLSDSRRNRAQPVTIWTWSKVVRRLAGRAALPRFSTHTLRHLRLTDLARAGWDIHEIALFAGHRNTATTLRYIHRSGRELGTKLARGLGQIHAWRAAQMAEVLG